MVSVYTGSDFFTVLDKNEKASFQISGTVNLKRRSEHTRSDCYTGVSVI